MASKKKYILYLIPLTLIVPIYFYSNSFWNEKKEDSVKIPETEIISKTVESRTAEVSIDKKFDIDRKKLAFKTNKKGELQATYIVTHSTQKDEKIVFYAFLEDDNSPIIMEVNGQKAAYHMISVPKKGQTKFEFTLSGLPLGEHIVYLFGEKYLENGILDELEVIQTQQAVAQNYFSLDVHNSNTYPLKVDNLFKTVEIIEDSYDAGLISMELYSDLELSMEVDFITDGDYFLVITNSREFELKAHLKLVSDYKAEELEQIIVPANSKVMLPVNLDNNIAQDSIRFVLVGEPTDKINIDFLARTILQSKRFPVE